MDTPMLDEIRKKASNRSLIKDFVAGVDPTGAATFRYGVSDVGDPESRNRLRKAVGVAGGMLAGALLIPSLLYGTIKGGGNLFRAQGFLNRIRGAATGFGRGFVRPYRDIFHGMRGRKYLINLRGGYDTSDAGLNSINYLARSQITPALQMPGVNKRFLRFLATEDPEQYQALVSETGRSVANALAFMILGGAVNAASADIQYNLGQRLGRQAGPEARARMVGIS